MGQNQLLFLFNKLIQAELQPNDFKELICLCSKIALSILIKRNGKHFRSWSSNDYELHDLATDAITPLFIKDKSDELPLKKASLKWDYEIVDEASAYYFFSKIISSRVEQEISKKLKEADPFFGKILRSINYVIEKKCYSKTSYFGVIYIVENEQIVIEQMPPTVDFIESLNNSLFQSSNENIIVSLFQFLKTETDFFPAIPLNALVYKIKHLHSDNFAAISSAQPSNIIEQLDVQRITEISLRDVFQRLDKFYVGNGKLNQEDSLIFKKVLEEYANDLMDGGISRGLYDYLNDHLVNISKEDFYKKYHQNLDYLIRLLKKGIAERLELEK